MDFVGDGGLVADLVRAGNDQLPVGKVACQRRPGIDQVEEPFLWMDTPQEENDLPALQFRASFSKGPPTRQHCILSQIDPIRNDRYRVLQAKSAHTLRFLLAER